MTMWDDGRGRAAGLPRWTRLARGGETGGGGGDTCNFEALGLTRESWAGLPAEDQSSLVVRFLVSLGRGTAEELAAAVGALPDGAARLAYLERESGCTVPLGSAPGGGGGGGGESPPPPPEGGGRNPFVDAILAGGESEGGAPTGTSTLDGGAATFGDAGAVRGAAAEGERWVLVGDRAPRRSGGAALALLALAVVALSSRRRR